ncbi:MAG: oligoendopeptidase F [Firmicutes bacterium]|nr:oligoendopeptidase F [Bacillota bacterium]
MSGKKPPKRSDIPAEYKWDIEKIYATDEAWQEDCAAIRQKLTEAAQYKGKLSQGADIFYDCLRYQDDLSLVLEKAFVYAAMRRDEDNTVAKYQEMFNAVESLAVQANAELSFFAPELSALPEETVESYLQDPRVAVYRHAVEEITRMKKHTLSPEEEMLLAHCGEMASSFDTIYSMLADADLQFPEITNENGEKEQLSHGNFIRFLQSAKRSVRQQAFDAMYDTFGNFSNTVGAIYTASVKKDVFYARCRKYEDALAASLDGDHIPRQVYRQLIDTVRSHLGDLARYLQVRRRALGLDELHMYDLYTPLLPDLHKKYDYQQAKQIVLQALSPLGAEYTQQLRHGLENGWVDVYENKGKTSGAYSSGCYATDPYILLNYQDNLNGVFTLAHEAGHSMHSWYTHTHQPYVYGNYRIFVAEVASTVNENLLIEYMLAHTEDEPTRLALLNHFLEEFRATVFRQTMFAEFEWKTHQLTEQGESLSSQSLNDMYYRLNQDYFGDEVEIDEKIAREWMRIPHFYRAFYVYKYATGFSAACALAQGLLHKDPQTAEANRQNYLRFLSGGCSADPIDLLKGAGVDMTKAEPLEAAMSLFRQRLEQLAKGLQ